MFFEDTDSPWVISPVGEMSLAECCTVGQKHLQASHSQGRCTDTILLLGGTSVPVPIAAVLVDLFEHPQGCKSHYESLFKWTIRPDESTFKQVVARDHLELSRWCASISSSRLPTSCRYSPSVKLEKCQSTSAAIGFLC